MHIIETSSKSASNLSQSSAEDTMSSFVDLHGSQVSGSVAEKFVFCVATLLRGSHLPEK